MYEVKKRFEISAAHKLDLDYDSKCTNFHGHNWIIDVYLQSETLDNIASYIKDDVKIKLL